MSENCNYFANPILNHLLSDFCNLINNKIYCEAKEDMLLQQLFEEPKGAKFFEILNGLANVANHHSSQIVKWLIHWHNRKVKDVIDRMNPKDTTSQSKDSLQSTDHFEIYDICLFISVSESLKTNEKPLDKKISTELIKLVYKILRERFSNTSTEAKKENQNYIMSYLCHIIDTVVSKNLVDFSKLYFIELDACNNMQDKSNVILSIRQIKIKSFSIDHVEGVFLILENITKIMMKIKEKETRVPFLITISEILTTFSVTAKTELNLPCVKNTIEILYPLAWEFLKKVKFLHLAIPFITSVLSCTTRTFFFANYSIVTQSIIPSAKSRDLPISRLALECLDKIIWVYLVRYNGEDSEKTNKFLSNIVSNIFMTSRTQIFTELPQILIKIIHTISQTRINYAVTDIILELCLTPTNKHFCPEKTSVGLKAFIFIIDSSPKRDLSFLPINDCFYQTTRFSTIRKAVSSKVTWSKISFENERKMMVDVFFQTVWHHDTNFGRPFLRTSPAAATKYTSDQTNADKKTRISLFKQCVTYIPKFPITEDILEDLVELLVRLTLHVDEDIEIRALKVLRILIFEYAKFGSTIIQTVSNTYLREIPSTCPDVITSVLINLVKLVQFWRTCLSNETPLTTATPGFYAIEGFCLIGLCSPLVDHRTYICQILKETKSIQTILQLKEPIEMSLYDEICKLLVERYSTKWEGYYNWDLAKLFDQISLSINWNAILSEIFRDTSTAYNCSSAVTYARIKGYYRFISSHNLIESCSIFVESYPRLHLANKTKKLPNYCDTQSWQNYFTLFCAPALVPEPDISDDALNESEESNTLTVVITQTFTKALSLLKADYNDIRNVCCDALSFTHSSIVPILISTISPLLKEIIDQKADSNSRKRKKRDIIMVKVLEVFANIATNGNLTQCVQTQEDTVIQPLIEYCDYCRNSLLTPELGYTFESFGNHLAVIIYYISVGIFDTNHHQDISPTSRESYYQLFISWKDSSNKSVTDEQIIILFDAMFSLLYMDNLLTNVQFKIPISSILSQIQHAINNTAFRSKSTISNTIQNLLLSNEYIQELTTWVFNQIYISEPQLSSQLIFIILDYFERKDHFNQNLIKILSLIIIKMHSIDSILYLRIKRSLMYIQNILPNSDPYTLPIPQKEPISACTQRAIFYIVKYYKAHFLALFSEFFQTFHQCDFTLRINLLSSLQILLSHISMNMHSDYKYTNVFDFDFPVPNPVEKVDFDNSIIILNNLMYLTFSYHYYHFASLQACWVALCSHGNNFIFLMHYLMSLGYYDNINMHSLIKTIFEFLYPTFSNFLIKFISSHVINEQNIKLKIVAGNSPSFFVASVAPVIAKESLNTKILSMSSSVSYLVYACKFLEMFKINDNISYYSTLIIFASNYISLGPIPIEDNFIIFMHLAINEMFSSNYLISYSSRNLITNLCMLILNISKLPDDVKTPILQDFNTLISSFQCNLKGFAFSTRKKMTLEKLQNNVAAQLINSIDMIKSNLNMYEFNSHIPQHQYLSTFITFFLQFLNYCEFDDSIVDKWCHHCVYFATNSTSINISCYSLFIFRTLDRPLTCVNLFKLIECFCKTATDSTAEIKKFTYEILTTIHSVAGSLLKLEHLISKDQHYPIVVLFKFFLHNLIIKYHTDISLALTFFHHLFRIPEETLIKIFNDAIPHCKCLIFAIINILITENKFHEQCLQILVKILPYLECALITPDPNLGHVLICIMVAFFYIDSFIEPVQDLSSNLLSILATFSLHQNSRKIANIFNMFRGPSKRKDVNLFLSMLFNELVGMISISLVKFIMKLLIDIIGCSEYRSIRNGLILINVFIESVGPHNIPDVCLLFLIQHLPSYLKNNSYSKISYQVSRTAFEPASFAKNTCPHVFMAHDSTKTEESKCMVCETESTHHTDLLNWILSNDFFADYDISTQIASISELSENTNLGTAAEAFTVKDMVADIQVDYDIRVKNSFNDHNQADNHSISSTQMLDDILDAINYLDNELENTNSKESTMRYHINITIPPLRITSDSEISSADLSSRPKSQSYVKSIDNLDINDIIDDQHILSDTDNTEISESSAISKSGIVEDYSTDIKLDTSLSITLETSDSISAPSILSDVDLTQNWTKAYNDCSSSLMSLNMEGISTSFNSLNSLLPPIMYRVYTILSNLCNYMLSRYTIEFTENSHQLTSQFIKIIKYMDDVFMNNKFPHFLFLPDSEFASNLINFKFLSIFLRITTCISNSFQLYSQFTEFYKDENNVNLHVIKDFIQIISPDLVPIVDKLRLFEHDQGKICIYDMKRDISILVAYESLKNFINLIELYFSYIENFHVSARNINSDDISNLVSSHFRPHIETDSQFSKSNNRYTNFQCIREKSKVCSYFTKSLKKLSSMISLLPPQHTRTFSTEDFNHEPVILVPSKQIQNNHLESRKKSKSLTSKESSIFSNILSRPLDLYGRYFHPAWNKYLTIHQQNMDAFIEVTHHLEQNTYSVSKYYHALVGSTESLNIVCEIISKAIITLFTSVNR